MAGYAAPVLDATKGRANGGRYELRLRPMHRGDTQGATAADAPWRCTGGESGELLGGGYHTSPVLGGGGGGGGG